MTEPTRPRPGTMGWIDLTVDHATRLRDFYAEVVGWRPADVDMGGYADFTMTSGADGTPVAGVCHRRGPNADLPPVWIPYFVVEDLGRSLEAGTRRGATVISGPKEHGGARYCVLRDPAGAVCALYQPAP